MHKQEAYLLNGMITKKDLENCVINSRKQSNSESDYSIIYTTGASDTNCVMNIYDFGGNVWEWTLENGQTPSRANVNRGGAYNGTGLNSPISTRNRSTSIGSSFHNVGFRVTMYQLKFVIDIVIKFITGIYNETKSRKMYLQKKINMIK